MDASVTSGSFVLGTQVLSGIAVGQNGSGGVPSAPNPPAVASPQLAMNVNADNTAQTSAQGPACNTAQMAGTAGCKVSAKTAAAQSRVAGEAAAFTAPISAISTAGKQLGGMLNGIFGGPASSPAAPAPTKSGTGQ